MGGLNGLDDARWRNSVIAATVCVAGLLCVLFSSCQPNVQSGLLQTGQWRQASPWQWWTASWTHLNARHLLANLLGLLVCAWVAARFRQGLWLPGVLSGSGVATLLGLAHGPVGVAYYGGLSGALYGVYAWLALVLIQEATQRRQRLIGLLLLIGELAKVGWDWLQPAQGTGWLQIVVVPAAHLWGMVGGLSLAVLIYLLRR
ncbi:rhomboid family GlyGly-CTERM serine protease [Chitinivorax tropicus]|uniref:Rhomboid family GlyGly-CTERM serine protease n=1 Tax=Chitinivorax tropicus TaxID=714531 RepID=A0A840MPC1_9PROT|nr:rhombosortase [Chitinivorax tropicus]MBB5018336.1 rhomboid family GlyGly-CTERM serine protease [Chitinivorax tropicus]